MKGDNLKLFILQSLFLVALTGISIDVYNNSEGGTFISGLSTFKYFSLQSNALVLLFSAGTLFCKSISQKSWFRYALGPLTAYLLLTGLVYLIVLEPIYDSVGLKRVSSVLLHYVTPSLMFVYWYMAETRRYRYVEIFKWLIYPVIFMVWGLMLAMFRNDYLYPFFDTEQYGANVAIYLMLVAIGFSSMIMLIIFINNTFLTEREARRAG